MSQVTLTRVFRKNIETKYGVKPNLSIQTDKHGDKWLSTFKVDGTASWKEGDTVDINVKENGEFLNFEPAGANRPGTNTNVEERLSRLEVAVFGQKETPQEDIIADADLPDMTAEEAGDGF